MKKILFIFVATLLIASCKEDTKEQIHLEDYNHSQTEKSNDSTVVDSTTTSNAGIDSTAVATKEDTVKEK